MDRQSETKEIFSVKESRENVKSKSFNGIKYTADKRHTLDYYCATVQKGDVQVTFVYTTQGRTLSETEVRDFTRNVSD